MTEEKIKELTKEINAIVSEKIFPKYISDDTDMPDCLKALGEAFVVTAIVDTARFSDMNEKESAEFILEHLILFGAQVLRHYKLSSEEMQEVGQNALAKYGLKGANA